MSRTVFILDGDHPRARSVVGSRAAALAELAGMDVPIPPGFTISTAACRQYYANERQMPDSLWDEVVAALMVVSKETGKRFGDPNAPLLLSVRVSPPSAMPGLLDGVCCIGLEDRTTDSIAALTGNPRFAYEAYRRFIMQFAHAALSGDFPDLRRHKFEGIFDDVRQRADVKISTDADAQCLAMAVRAYKEHFLAVTGSPFPTDPMAQLRSVVVAALSSWGNERAVAHRGFHKVPHDLGTAVIVDAMVFGNLGDDSGTGVTFTRDVVTGENTLYGEFLMNAHAEDLIVGRRTPVEIAEMRKIHPTVYDELVVIARRFERHFSDVMDIEFVIERGRLFVLGCRVGRRTGAAAVKIAVDMAGEGLLSKQQAVSRVQACDVRERMRPRLVKPAGAKPITQGLGASPGGAVGHLALSNDVAMAMAGEGRRVILVRPEVCPDDIRAILLSYGLITQRGGATSHGAVVARGLGIPAVSRCQAMTLDEDAHTARVGDALVREGDTISIDGMTGEVFGIGLPLRPAAVTGDLAILLGWADDLRTLEVWANADSPSDIARAISFGAQGVGLCRTEGMFMGDGRLSLIQEVALAEGEVDRQASLLKLLPLVRSDFVEVFEAAGSRPVAIRLFDPPLQDFLPSRDDILIEATRMQFQARVGADHRARMSVLVRLGDLHESNPMLGLRGVRLYIAVPGIAEMQMAAIVGAACEVSRSGVQVQPQVIIPMVSDARELLVVKERLEAVAARTMAAEGVRVDYSLGAMVEVPRAALTADEIAKAVQFFSFGTNDLTQTTFGYSRDDAEGKFLLKYVEDKILPENPFQTLDVSGVGQLVDMAVRKGRAANPSLELGICGEHAGDPESIAFCHRIGLDYVSCSPVQVPVARLAAAQAALAQCGSRVR